MSEYVAERRARMDERMKIDLDNYITGHWGEDQAQDFEDEEDDEMHPICSRCNGTGTSIEGLDCEYCGGDGYTEL